MGKLVISAMPLSKVEDLAGEAYLARIRSAGFTDFNELRVGRRFTLRVDGPVTEEHIEAAREVARRFLVEPEREEVVRIYSTDSDESTVPWEDFEEVWGGDASDEFSGLNTADMVRNPEAHGHEIPVANLGAVEAGSMAVYYVDDFEEPG